MVCPVSWEETCGRGGARKRALSETSTALWTWPQVYFQPHLAFHSFCSFNSTHASCPHTCWSRSWVRLVPGPAAGVLCFPRFMLSVPLSVASSVTLPSLPLCHSKLPQTRRLNQQTRRVSRFRHVTVLAGLGPPEAHEGSPSCRPLSVACGWLSPPCVLSHRLPWMCACLCIRISSFCKNSSYTGLGSSLMPSF